MPTISDQTIGDAKQVAEVHNIKKSVFVLYILFGFILGILFSIVSLISFPKLYKIQIKESIILSPSSDYVDYDPLENLSDSTAMILQEMRCDKIKY